MSTYAQLYWLTRLDGLVFIFSLMAILSMLATLTIIISTAMEADSDECERKKFRRALWYIMPVGFVFLFGSILTPDKNDMIFIIAGGKTIDWAKNDTSLCKIPSQTTAIISEFLDKQIKELNKAEDKQK